MVKHKYCRLGYEFLERQGYVAMISFISSNKKRILCQFSMKRLENQIVRNNTGYIMLILVITDV
jgi:predicted regulator of Ras-like GTPase activity (Roadblock/LC7/MglB family)